MKNDLTKPTPRCRRTLDLLNEGGGSMTAPPFFKAPPPIFTPRPLAGDTVERLWMLHDETTAAVLAGPPERPSLQIWLPKHRIRVERLKEGLVRLTIPFDLSIEMGLP